MTRSEAWSILEKHLKRVAALKAVQSDAVEDLPFARALATALKDARRAAERFEAADDDSDP